MSYLNYEQMIDRALLSVVRDAFRQIETDGFKGGHHLYLSFLTQFPGVMLPQDILHAYPEEITIVLQHEFWNLKVDEHKITVDVKFDERVEFIEVPFQCITHISDPSVNFELEFNPKVGKVTHYEFGQKGSGDKEKDTVAEVNSKDNIVSLDHFRKK